MSPKKAYQTMSSVFTSVETSDGSQILIHRIIYIIEGKCFVLIEISTLSSNLPFMSVIFWPNMPFLGSEIGLFTTIFF